jgi:demethylmenaquinone methyltransferase/2-methoxy-6-polyprenyl-1,4-benzoquinol methylase
MSSTVPSDLQNRFATEGGKQPYVRNMFGRISGIYDTMNKLMTAGLDRRWRHFAVRQLALGSEALGLDIGTGTADLAIEAIRSSGPKTRMIGIDVTPQMLDIGRKKIARLGLNEYIELRECDGDHLDFADNMFEGIGSAFVMRNVGDLATSIAEQFRVLKPGGRMVCLEITHPPNPLFSLLFHFYFDHLIPLLGKIVGRSFESYSYLHQSLAVFPHAYQLKEMMEKAGFDDVHYHYLTLGVVAVHVGIKKP